MKTIKKSPLAVLICVVISIIIVTAVTCIITLVQPEKKVASSDITITESNDDGVLKKCYLCKNDYSVGGYIIQTKKNAITLCKLCRDKLMRKNSSIHINGKDIYPFDDKAIYQGELISFEVPNSYTQTDIEERLIKGYNAEFCDNSGDVLIVYKHENFFDGIDVQATPEKRQQMSFTPDSTNIRDTQKLLEPEDTIDYFNDTIQGLVFFSYHVYPDMIVTRTIKDGVIYTFAIGDTAERSEISTNDLIFVIQNIISSIAFPTLKDVIEYYDSNGFSSNSGELWQVDTDKTNLNVRDKPKGNKIGSLPKGTVIRIKETEQGWGHAYDENGETEYGWIDLSFCTDSISMSGWVYIVPGGKYYHTKDCKYIKNDKNALRDDADQAYESGYRACPSCGGW